MADSPFWMIWPGNAALSALTWFVIAMPFLYAARAPMHGLLRSLGQLAGGPLRLAARALLASANEMRERNRAALPFKPADLDAVVLTHAHLDHSGYLPLLVRNGFRGPIHCTSGTADLCNILLPDSGAIQEEDAARANRRGYTRHNPAEPLYTRNDADACLAQFVTHDFGSSVRLFQGLDVTFTPAGHILGSASTLIRRSPGRRSGARARTRLSGRGSGSRPRTASRSARTRRRSPGTSCAGA